LARLQLLVAERDVWAEEVEQVKRMRQWVLDAEHILSGSWATPGEVVKYEEVYLKDYASPREAREELRAYLRFYNERRLHQSLGYCTPAEVYFAESGKEHTP
jgi:transposase InsO family protein